jgi:hypothetical protein
MQPAAGFWSGPEGWQGLWHARRDGTVKRRAVAWLAWWPKWKLPFFRRKKPRPMPEPVGAERRESFRYGISLETSVRLMAAVEGDPLPVRVRNISAGGISLVLHRAVETETILPVQLLNRPQMFLCDVQVRVTYVVEHPSGDWIIGGAFTRKLAEEELRSLLS